MKHALGTVVLALAVALGAAGARAGEALPLAADPALEALVTRIASELRCLVCQNQTLADSQAGLAMDLKQQVREQLAAGRSDAEVIEYMVARYGDFVLYRPPVKSTTAVLWYGPLVLLGFGVVLAVHAVRRRRAAPPPLDETARRDAAALLADTGESAR